MDMQRLLKAAIQFKASDLHIQVGSPPTVRVDGTMVGMNVPAVSAEEVRELVEQVAEKAQRDRIETERSCDFSYFVPELARFRINIFYEQGASALSPGPFPWRSSPSRNFLYRR